MLRRSESLTEDQLDTTVVGVFGSIIETFRHIVRSESGYYRRLTGDEPAWLAIEDDTPGIEELAERNRNLEQRWLRFLETPFDAERTIITPWWNGGERAVPAGVVLGQAIHHGSDHRSQICTILTSIGIEPPDLGLWDWAEDTDRAPIHSS